MNPLTANTTGLDIIQGGALLANAGDQYNTPDGPTTNLYLAFLNNMLDLLSTAKPIIFSTAEGTFPLIAGTAAYTIGPGQSLGLRPVLVQSISIYDANGISFPVRMIGPENRARIAFTAAPGRPEVCWFDYGFPNCTATFYPTPAFSTDVAHVWYGQALTQFTATSALLSMPPGYGLQFMCNLALYICALAGKEPSAALSKIARESRRLVDSSNWNPMLLWTDLPAALANRWRFNIYTGETQ